MTPMLMRRVTGFRPDPADPQRRIYTLDCGHAVSRRTRGNKRIALCDRCGQRALARAALRKAGDKAVNPLDTATS